MQQEGKPSGTVKQAVERTGLNRNEIYKLIASGEVLTAKFGRKRILDFPSLDAAIAKRMQPGAIDPDLSKLMATRRRKQEVAA
jgi:excisionase family DNA binding protein